MKVLKTGEENDKLETMEVSCTGIGFPNQVPCGALLEINGLDVHRGASKDYGGGSDEYFYITCPICGAKTEIYKKDMPEQIKSMAQWEDKR